MGIFSRFSKKKETSKELLILYGTKSGNSQLIAQEAQKYYQKIGVDSFCKNMASYKPNHLASVKKLLIIVSTHGEGEPPPSAKTFFNDFLSNSMPQLHNLSYSVCALGDSSYNQYCWAGKILDERLCRLGASSFYRRQDCDTEFSESAIQWIKGTASKWKPENSSSIPMDLASKSIANTNNESYHAIVKKRELLSKSDSHPVFHVVLDISQSDITYNFTDSVEIIPQNPEDLVNMIATYFNEEDNIHFKETIAKKCEITSISKKTIAELQKHTKSSLLQNLIQSTDELEDAIRKANIFDILSGYKIDIDPETFINIVPKLKARIYSIASSQNLHRNELHLTIKTIRYSLNSRLHEGACSNYLNACLPLHSSIQFKLLKNEFLAQKLGGDCPVIMIGVSTGIAPFRAILQDRFVNKKYGNTWLIWGNKNKDIDFLYQDELNNYVKKGLLERIDTTFSRDEKDLKYVYEVLKTKSSEIKEWLLKGAHIFICGSTSMANSVRSTLQEELNDTEISPQKLLEKERWHEEIY